jgi:hypothetical protein
VDVVISPVKTTLLGNVSAGYPLVMGDLNIMKLIKLLKPKVNSSLHRSSQRNLDLPDLRTSLHTMSRVNLLHGYAHRIFSSSKVYYIFHVQVLVPLLNAEIDQEGPLSSIVVDRGDYEEVTKQITSSQPGTRVEFPASPGEALAVAL